MAVSANRIELLQIADAVAREKVIDRSIVVAAMEEAIAKAARSRYGAETDVHAEIHPRTGELRLATDRGVPRRGAWLRTVPYWSAVGATDMSAAGGGMTER